MPAVEVVMVEEVVAVVIVPTYTVATEVTKVTNEAGMTTAYCKTCKEAGKSKTSAVCPLASLFGIPIIVESPIS